MNWNTKFDFFFFNFKIYEQLQKSLHDWWTIVYTHSTKLTILIVYYGIYSPSLKHRKITFISYMHFTYTISLSCNPYAIFSNNFSLIDVIEHSNHINCIYWAILNRNNVTKVIKIILICCADLRTGSLTFKLNSFLSTHIPGHCLAIVVYFIATGIYLVNAWWWQ